MNVVSFYCLHLYLLLDYGGSLHMINMDYTVQYKILNQKAPQGGCGHRRQHARLR